MVDHNVNQILTTYSEVTFEGRIEDSRYAIKQFKYIRTTCNGSSDAFLFTFKTVTLLQAAITDDRKRDSQKTHCTSLWNETTCKQPNVVQLEKCKMP